MHVNTVMRYAPLGLKKLYEKNLNLFGPTYHQNLWFIIQKRLLGEQTRTVSFFLSNAYFTSNKYLWNNVERASLSARI